MLRKQAYEISYEIANRDSFPIHYMLQNDTISLCDTIIYYKKIPTINSDSIYAYLESNSYAKLKRSTYKSRVKEVKEYLLTNNRKADTTTIEKMAKYLFYLSTNNTTIYKNDREIPIYKQLSSVSEIIKTNMDADYFYLVGIEKESALKDFIKKEIINDFIHGKSNNQQGEKELQLIPINTGFDIIKGNYLYLFLCGISKDWNYKYIPIGGVLIDDVPPLLSFESNLFNNIQAGGYNSMEKFDNYYIDFNYTNSIRTNVISFNWGNFEGDNYFGYSIPFTVKFSILSDLNEIIIQGKTNKVNRSIEMGGGLYNAHSIFRFEHHFRKLNTGDNFIKVDFIDIRGNKSTATINIKTQRIKDKETEINNNIYNNIYQ